MRGGDARDALRRMHVGWIADVKLIDDTLRIATDVREVAADGYRERMAAGGRCRN